MKRTGAIILMLFIVLQVLSQKLKLEGTWQGAIKLSEDRKIEFIFTFEKDQERYVTTVDIPGKRVFGLKPNETSLDESGQLIVDASNLGFKYQGKFEPSTNQILGTYMEGVNNLPLSLSRESVSIKEKLRRPQEPKRPLPYIEEEVTFTNDGVTLSGTLTIPEKVGKFPAVLLISGSGPQDRDETFANHKPFLVISDYLTRNGFAVLRYDDRGIGKSTGIHTKATTRDLATDAFAAMKYLKSRKDIKRVGLMGHSEGGIIAPMVANWAPGDISFCVLLAATGLPGSEISIMQTINMRDFPVPDEKAYEQNVRRSIEIAAKDGELNEIKAELTDHYNKTVVPIAKNIMSSNEEVQQFVTQLIELRTGTWMRYFYNYNPSDEIEKLTCPVLSLNGSKDVQVNASINQQAIKKALEKGNNPDFEVLEMPGLNHLFQECEKCSIREYSEIEQTIYPIVLEKFTSWMKERA